jgi:hypothetical protein
MITWQTYYVERQRRQDEIEQAVQHRLVRSVTARNESRLTKLRITILDIVGAKLVQWGCQLQSQCVELSLTSPKRAI